MVEVMFRLSVIGIENSVVIVVSSSELGRWFVMSLVIGICVVVDCFRLLCVMLVS